MLLPELATPADFGSLEQFLRNDKWVFEQKLDGHRLLLKSPGEDMPPTALTRSGSIYTRRLPRAIQDFRFPDGQWALDGELVDGTFYVFDLPVSILKPNAELWARRAALEALLSAIQHPFKIVPQARTWREKEELATKAVARNLEGLILKQVDSPYRPGARCTEWLKIKFVATADCIVLGVRDDGKDSVRLGMRDPIGLQTVDVGRASLIGKEKRCPINVGDVVEVRYLYTGAQGRLYQPTILRKRDDKLPSQCTIDQMKMVNKEVLEAL